MQWYYGINGQQYGPVEDEALFALAREGKLKPDDYVWNPSMGSQWAKASTVAGLFAQTAPPAVPPPVEAAWSATDSFASRTHNRDLMAQARACLTGNWGLAVGVVIVAGVISAVAGSIPILGVPISLLISGPLALGINTVFLSIAIGQKPPFSTMFDGFKQFGVALGAYLLMLIFTFLWSLLLIVPGIIAAIRYSIAYFILAETPEIGPLEAIRRSKQMMHGNKWKWFCLQWRFLGWALLCVLSCGIGFLWLGPYMTTSNARFYEDLRAGRQSAQTAGAPASQP